MFNKSSQLKSGFGEYCQGRQPLVLSLTLGMVLIAPLMGLDAVIGTGYHDTQRWMELAALAVIAVVALVRLVRGALALPALKSPGAWWVCLAGVLGLISALLSTAPRQAFFEVGVFFLLLLTAWLIAAEVAQRGAAGLESVLAWVVVGSLLYGFKAMVAYLGALLSGAQPDPANLIPGFDTYRFFNHEQTVTLPLLGLYVCLQAGKVARSRGWLAAGWMALVVWWMLLFASAGRGTLVAMAVVMLAAGVGRGSRAWPWVRTMAWGALAGGAAYVLLYMAVPQWLGLESFGFFGGIVQRSVDNFGSSRGALWACAIQMVLQNPWLGAGPLHYAQVCAPLQVAAHPHNWVLQIAAEWGLLALGCIGAALLLAFRALHGCGAVLDERDERNQAMLTCWLATGIAIVLDGLVSGLLVMPVSQLWIASYAGLAWGWVRAVRPPSGGPPVAASLSWRCFAGGVILAAAGLLTVGVAATLASAHSAESEGLRLAPRAWGSGFFGVLR